MNTIYVVYTGCYSDTYEYGYTTNEEEAKMYCEYMNQHNPNSWKRYNYYALQKITPLEKQKEQVVSLFRVTVEVSSDNSEWEIVEIAGSMEDKENAMSLRHYLYDNSDYSGDSELTLNFVGLRDENHAKKAAQDLIAEVKEKYCECEDWKLTMSCFGGFVY